MAVIDCFLFWREFDVLDIRLHELEGVVDRFVLVEAPRTFSGKQKPLHFADQAYNYAEWPITHVVVRDLPIGPDPWQREYFQRNAIMRGLAEAKESDLVLISDLDEVPSRQALIKARPVAEAGAVVRFDQPLCYYYLNAALPSEGTPSLCTRMLLAKDLVRGERTPQDVRQDHSGPVVSPGGWHFGWLGDAEFAREKIRAFSHQELNHEALTTDDYLGWCIAQGKHVKERRQIYRFPEEELPAHVREHRERYRRWLAPSSIPPRVDPGASESALRRCVCAVRGAAPGAQA